MRQQSVIKTLERTILERALEVWGDNLQEDIAIEEMSELIKAIIKNRRSNPLERNKHKKYIAEEIADVEICLNSLKLIHSIDDSEIGLIKQEKLKRLENRITDIEKRNQPIDLI